MAWANIVCGLYNEYPLFTLCYTVLHIGPWSKWISQYGRMGPGFLASARSCDVEIAWEIKFTVAYIKTFVLISKSGNEKSSIFLV